MIDPLHIESLLKFLDIQRKHWKAMLELTVLASVRAIYFLHIVRFGRLSETSRPDLDSEHSYSASHAREVAVIVSTPLLPGRPSLAHIEIPPCSECVEGYSNGDLARLAR